MTTLDAREHTVLTTIVDQYIAEATPVGSRSVARISGLALSPASIRNTMADLTDTGYLDQPHTSAGRVPTAKAFRYYLDTVLRQPVLAEDDRRLIEDHLGSAGLELTDILRQASRLLSSFSRQVSMVLAPAKDDVRWRHIDFALVSPGLVMAVLVLEGGLVQNRLVEAEPGLTQDDLTTFGNYLNHHYTGRTLGEVRANLVRELDGARRRLKGMYRRALRLARDAFASDLERDFFFDGTVNLPGQPEFADLGNMRELLHLLEERTRLLELLDRTMEGGRIKVSLGRETKLDVGPDYGFIASPYGGGEHSRGVVGIIGPLRMDYARVVPLVDYTARMLSQVLSKRF